MCKFSYDIIYEKTKKFIKHIFDDYENPQELIKILYSTFQRKNITCGFNWTPSNEYYGEINVFYIISNEVNEHKREILKKSKTIDLLTNKLLLHDFIYYFWNPEGAFLLEKIMFELEG